MTDEARAAQREYMRAYREKNREKVNAVNRKWLKEHPEKAKEYRERYWSKKHTAIKEDTQD